MKKFFAIAPLGLVVVLASIYWWANGGAPLKLGIVGFTNINGGSQSLQIRLTNDSALHFVFSACVQSFSDTGRRELVAETCYHSSGQVLPPRSVTGHTIHTFQNGGVIQVRIAYQRLPTNFQHFLNKCLMRFGRGPLFKPSEMKEIKSGPIPLPRP